MPGIPFTSASATVQSKAAHAARRAIYAALRSGLPDDPYQRERAKQTRKDIVRARARLAKATDGAEFDRLASAISKLSELERTLAGRPLPGTLKPQPPKERAPKFSGPE
jgi:hypothetical protein